MLPGWLRRPPPSTSASGGQSTSRVQALDPAAATTAVGFVLFGYAYDVPE